MAISITHAATDPQLAEVRALFREYESWLGLSLCFQGFEAEVAGLPGRYAPPGGRLLIASQADAVAGCVALRALTSDICEMKRLFVRDEFRGDGVGRSLIAAVIDEARQIGYSRMRLDTYPPKMATAVRSYTAHGFYPIEPYYDNPFPDVLYMEAVL